MGVAPAPIIVDNNLYIQRYGNLISRLSEAETAAGVDEDDALLADGDHEIGLAITVDVAHRSGRRKILFGSGEPGPHVCVCLPRIPSRKLCNLYLALYIHDPKVRWVSGAIAVPYHRIELEYVGLAGRRHNPRVHLRL